jgi:hypothetical protein
MLQALQLLKKVAIPANLQKEIRKLLLDVTSRSRHPCNC